MKLDHPYVEADPIHPHYAHMLQPLDEGLWLCIDCGEFQSWMMDHGFTTLNLSNDGLEVS